MAETESYSSDWSQLLDDMPNEPGNIVTPRTQTVTAGSNGLGSIPISSSFASSNKTTANKGSTSSRPEAPNNGNNKGRFPFWLILLLLLLLGGSASVAAGINPVYRGLKIVGIEFRNGRDGVDGIDGEDGRDGKVTKQTNIISSSSSVSGSGSGSDGANGTNGSDGADGAAGANGVDGSDGSDGADGTNACISGLCVSRQTTSPGTQEEGNINIDGTVLATQIGINDTTPSNTLTVNGTMDVSGHTSFGGAFAVDGATNPADALIGATSHRTTSAIAEILTTMNSADRVYEGLNAQLILNPDSAPVYGQVYGMAGGVNIASGNTEDFSGLLYGFSGGFSHKGSGTVSSGTGLNGAALNLNSGTVTEMIGLQSNVINYNPGAGGQGTVGTAIGVNVNFPVNAGTVTTYKGVNIKTPNNFGTITNNYGLYIEDESSVGSTLSYNIYSAGSTAKNYFAGLVGIGDSTPDYSLDVAGTLGVDGNITLGDDNTSDTVAMNTLATAITSGNATGNGSLGVTTNSLTSGIGLNVTSTSTGLTGALARIRVRGNDAGVTGDGLQVAVEGASATATGINLLYNGAGNALRVNDDGSASDATPFVIDADGKVGIGTATPGMELEISQGDTWETELGITNTTAGKTLRFTTSGNATANWNIANANAVLFFSNAAALETSLELYDTTNVGIGTTFTGAPVKLTVRETTDTNVIRVKDSDGTCDLNPEAATLDITCSSDERLKSNIRSAASALSEIAGLNIFDYTINASGDEATGLIAQDVMQTHPDWVVTGDDGYYKVKGYNPWKTLKAVQELDNRTKFLTDDFVTALEKNEGDITAAKQQLVDQGLRLDQISATLQDYATRLSDHDTRIQALESKVQSLEQSQLTSQ